MFHQIKIFFSLSHSRGLCAVAVADRPVGVDVEQIRADYPLNLIEQALCEDEKTVFDGDFTRIWCRKEAVAKLTGKGLVGYTQNINTTKYELKEEMIEVDGRKYWVVCDE